MKHIRVSVPDDVYRAARRHAAERGSSVGALVSEYLSSLAEVGAEFARLEAEQKQVESEIKGFRAADRLDRHALHDRGLR